MAARRIKVEVPNQSPNPANQILKLPEQSANFSEESANLTEQRVNLTKLIKAGESVVGPQSRHDEDQLQTYTGSRSRATIQVGTVVEVPVEVDISKLFHGSAVEDYFDFSHVLPELAKGSERGKKITKLTVSGVEQLTDMFFLVLKCQNIKLSSLDDFTLCGAPHVTDQGIKWLSEIPGIYIKNVSLEGCPKLTDRSLQILLRMKPQSIQMKGVSNISCLNPDASKKDILLSGCQLISPPDAKLQGDPCPVGKDIELPLVDFNFTKVVVLHESSIEKGQWRFIEEDKSNGNTFSVKKAWMPDAKTQKKYNVFECVLGTGCENWVLSNGCVIVLPFSNTDDETAKKLATKIFSIIGQFPENVFVLFNIGKTNTEMEMKRRVCKILQNWHNHLTANSITYRGNQDEKMIKEHDNFESQIQLGIGQTLLDNVQTTLGNLNLTNRQILNALSTSNNTALDSCETILTTHLIKNKESFLESATDTLRRIFPWHCTSFFQETISVFDAVMSAKFPTILSPLEVFKDQKVFPKETVQQIDPSGGHTGMSKAMEVLHTQGNCLFYPHVEKKPLVTDIENVPSLTNLGSKAPQLTDIPWIGNDVPCWRKDDFYKSRFNNVKEAQRNCFLDIMLDMGMMFRFAWPMKDPRFSDCLTFVMTDDLPDTPGVPLDDIWPAGLPNGGHQRDAYFTFPSLPQLFLPCFLRTLHESSQTLLLWKYGLVMRQGPVMVLVELLTNELNQGFPAIVISARVVHSDMKDALTVTFNNVTTILSGMLISKKVYAIKTVCCQQCNITRDRRIALRASDNCCHMTEFQFRYSFGNDDKIVCKKNKAGLILPKEEFASIDSGSQINRHFLVPNHKDMTKIVKKDYRMTGATTLTEERNKQMLTMLRCHLCNNCGNAGINCLNMREAGITNRHCRCNHRTDLCSFCGVCSHCIKVLTVSHSLVQPCFASKPIGDTPDVKKSTCILEFPKGKDSPYTYKLPHFLSLCYCDIVNILILSETLDLIVMISRVPSKSANKMTIKNCTMGDKLEISMVAKKVNGAFVSSFCLKRNDLQLHTYVIELHGQLELSLQPNNKDSDMKIMVTAPNLMSMGNIVEDEQSFGLVQCCSPAFPTKTERQMTMMYASMEDLMVKRIKQSSGSIGVLLPKSLTVNDLLYPTMELVKDRKNQLYYPICSLGLTEIDENRWPPVNFLHLVNGEGIPVADFENTKMPEYYVWGAHVIMSHYKMLDLPPFDQLFAEIAPAHIKNIQKSFLSYGIQSILRMAAINMSFSLGEGLSKESTKKKLPAPSALTNLVKRTIKKCGLQVKDGFILCPGHVACLEPDATQSEFQTDIFQGYKPFISHIKKTNNHLETIQKTAFEDLPNLGVFFLQKNFLEVLPDTVVKCKFLTELSLAENNLLDLPSAFYSCTGLTSLDISRNRFEKLPVALTYMGNLRILRASHLMLKVLPDNFGGMSKLTELDLTGNCLTSLPKGFKNLQKLTHLSLAGIKWFDNKSNLLLSEENFVTFLENEGIKRWIAANPEVMGVKDMFNLFDLDSSGTLDTHEIAKVNAHLFSIFPRFGHNGTEPPDAISLPFGGVPEELLSLKALTSLNLSYQGIISIPDNISKFTKLEKLNLNCNPNLLSLSSQTGFCPLKDLNLDDCPVLKTPPKEIRDRGFKTTLAYMKRLVTGSVDCKRTKLMLVGLGGAGKTSLVKSLMATNKKSNLTGADAITDGIDICTWNVNQKGQKISYSVWDFAGQTVYYNTHQFFLSDRAVYLLLWNIRLGHEHAGLNFWLNSITVHAPKAPIFVVGTHTDQMTKIELPMDEMKSKYHQIEGFHFVSSKDGKGIPELKEALFNTTLQQDYMGEQIPQAWLQLEKALTDQRDKSKVLDFKVVESKAMDFGIVDSSEINQAIQFLHDLGMIQHFSNEYLRSHVIIEPQWIVDVMACVVCVDQNVIKDGRLQHADIKKIWKDYQTMADWLLRLTEEFDLTFQLEGKKCNIVPCLLPEKRPEFTWPEVKKDEGILETKMIYKFDYLPGGLFNRGQVRLHGISEESVIWKRGSFIKKNGQLALVQQIGESLLHIKVQGPRPDNLLFFIHEVFESLINESFYGVAYECKIPCPDCISQYVKDPHMFKESGIRRALELKAPFFQCHKYFHTTPILSLQGILAPDNSKDYEVHLNNDVSALKQMQTKMTVDIFISYCAKDAPKDRSKVIHPADVYADLEKEGYTCYFPEGKDLSSREEMARRLVHASVFLVFVSTNYAADPVCCDMYKYAVNTMKKMTICVTVGDDFNWKGSTTLGVFISDVIFVNMVNSKKAVYKSKFDELLAALQKTDQLSVGKQDAKGKACFISYAWVNSKQAVALGSSKKEEALGYGDPREIKDFLVKKGIPCWIDIEQINVNDQLFHRLSKGLAESRIMVAFVSDEYAVSENCCKEIRFAVQLKLPVVVAVVGTGNAWKSSEVGFHAISFPTVDFQEQTKVSHDKLLALVKKHMLPEQQEDADEKKKKIELANAKQAQISFQEMFELAQRKFLRQISRYASEQDIGTYPRLFAIDIMAKSSQEDNEAPKEDADIRTYSIYTLCECEEGWHSVADPILLKPTQEAGVWQVDPTKYTADETLDITDCADYLARVTLVMEHNPDFVLRLHNDTEGQQFIEQIEELALNNKTDFMASYHELRRRIFDLDTEKTKGKLKRCRLPSGKTVWLCEEHCTKLKVMVLSEDTAEIKVKVANQPWLDDMVEHLRIKQKTPFEFNENKKSKRLPKGKVEQVQDMERNLRRSMSRSASTLGKEKLAEAMALVKAEEMAAKKPAASKTEELSVKIEPKVVVETTNDKKSTEPKVTVENTNDKKSTASKEAVEKTNKQYMEEKNKSSKPDVDKIISDVSDEPLPEVNNEPITDTTDNKENGQQGSNGNNPNLAVHNTPQKPKRAPAPHKTQRQNPDVQQSSACILF